MLSCMTQFQFIAQKLQNFNLGLVTLCIPSYSLQGFFFDRGLVLRNKNRAVYSCRFKFR